MGAKRHLPHWLDSATLWRACFALVLAILLWAWVTNQQDPDVAARFTGVTPAVVGRPADLVVLDQDKLPAVAVDVRGPTSAIQRVSASDLRATLDLSGVKGPGTVDLPVKVHTPAHVRVVGVTPRAIPVTVDRQASKRFPLEPETQPSPASYNITRVDVATKQVTVSGPAAAVGQVARVVLPIALGDHRDTFEAQFTPEARDAAGARVAGVTLDPASVDATVTVTRIGRTVSVVPDLVGTPPEGYRVASWTVSPPTVVVDGPQDALNQLIQISTAPIDVSGKTKSFSVYAVQLQLPNGIRLVDPVTINVQIAIELQQVRQQFTGLRVTAVNLGGGLRAAITPGEITITVSGPLDRLRQLNGGDLKVEADLQGLGPGVYTITPHVTLPPDLQLVDQPPAVRVEISRPPTPTPVPTATPVPTVTPVPTPRPTAAPTRPAGLRPARAAPRRL
ncbi:MAG TPA: CdaR family protein [Thermomicrobiales bacterium]|nr:CdaR family protein [Thermomicrobiales bacterium]